jgi:hypothetical protein
MSSTEYTWILDRTDLGQSSETSARFKKINANTNLIASDFTADGKYEISTYSDLIYLDLNDVLEIDTPFTLEFSLTETGSVIDITLPKNYITLGYHLRGSYGVTITVGRPVGSSKVVIGTITPDGVEKANILPTNIDIQPNVEYTYTLVCNILNNSTERIMLYRKPKLSSETPSLICDSQGLSNPYISLVNRKLFFGSSMWVNEPEWSNRFDVATMSITGVVKLLSREARDPSFDERHPDYPTNISVINADSSKPNAEFATTNDSIIISFISTKSSTRTNIIVGTGVETKTYDSLTFTSPSSYTIVIPVSDIISILPDQNFSFAVDFSGSVTSQIQTTTYISSSSPTLTYDVVSLYPTSVTFGLTSVAYSYFTDTSKSLTELVPTFYATDDITNYQLQITADVLNVNSTYTIEGLSLDTTYTVHAIVKHVENGTDLNVSGSISPTSNPTNDVVSKIKPVDDIVPMIDATRFVSNHGIGELQVPFHGVFVKDEHSVFNVYIGLFNKTDTVTKDLMLDPNNSGAIVSFLDHTPTTLFVDVTGGSAVFTHVMKYNGSAWEKGALEFDTTYFVHIYVNDEAVEVNEFLSYNYAIIEMNMEQVPYIVPQETIIQDPTTQNATVVSVFQTKITGDAYSPVDALVVGYDSTGNNNHLYVYPSPTTTTADEIIVDGVVNTHAISTTSISYVEMRKIDLSKPFTFSVYIKNTAEWLPTELCLIQYTDSSFIESGTTNYVKQDFIKISSSQIHVTQTDKTNNAQYSLDHSFVIDTPLQIDNWYNIVVSFDGRVIKSYVNNFECAANLTNTGLPYAISGKLYLPGGSTQTIHVDDIRMYNVELNTEIITQIVSNSTKLLHISFDTEYVFEYDVTMYNDVFYFNVDQTQIVLHKNMSYTFYQSNDNNTAPLIINVPSDPLVVVTYYRDSASVTKAEYETPYTATEVHDRKIVITVGEVTTDTSITYNTSSSGSNTSDMIVKSTMIEFTNKSNSTANAIHSGTTSYPKVSDDAPVGSGSFEFNATNQDMLTVPNQTVTANNMSITTWFKTSDTGVANPIMYQTGSFKFGINSTGNMELIIE